MSSNNYFWEKIADKESLKKEFIKITFLLVYMKISKKIGKKQLNHFILIQFRLMKIKMLFMNLKSQILIILMPLTKMIS